MTCCFPNLALVWKPGWMCQKSSVLLGGKEWAEVLRVCWVTHTVSIEACWGWCNIPGSGQTTSCTFGCADPGCGVGQYSQEETGWSSPRELSKGRQVLGYKLQRCSRLERNEWSGERGWISEGWWLFTSLKEYLSVCVSIYFFIVRKTNVSPTEQQWTFVTAKFS